MMTERWAAWMLYLEMRDTSLVNQASFAVALVLAYKLIPLLFWLPAKWRAPLQHLYLVAGVPLYVFTLLVGVLELEIGPDGAARLVVIGLPIAAAYLLAVWRRSPNVSYFTGQISEVRADNGQLSAAEIDRRFRREDHSRARH